MTSTEQASNIAERRAENEEKQEDFRRRLIELEDAIGENESARGRAVAAGHQEGAAARRREARELEQERDDLTAALGHLTAEAGELEHEQKETEARAAMGALDGAKTELDRDMDAVAAAIRAFHERELAGLIARMEESLQRVRRCERDVHRQAPTRAYSVSYLATAWNRVAPLYPLLQDLRAYMAGKPIIGRGGAGSAQVSTASGPGGTETVARGTPEPDAPLALR